MSDGKQRGAFDYPDIGSSTEGSVFVGGGVRWLPQRSNEVLIAARPDRKGQVASIRVQPDGTVLVNEREVGCDKDIVEGLRTLVYEMANIRHEYRDCVDCGNVTSRPVVPKANYKVWVCPACRQARRDKLRQ